MSNATNNTTTWDINADLGKMGEGSLSKTLLINTKETYVDRNIKVNITATAPSSATLGSSATGSATINSVTVGTKSGTSYPVTGSANITGTSSASTTASGYAVAGTTKASGSTTGTANLSATIAAAAATVSLSGQASSPTIAIDGANDNIIVGTITTTKPTSGYYAAVAATAPATTLTATKTVDTAGYLGSNSEITASGATTAKTGSNYYVPINSGSMGSSKYNSKTATGTDLANYTENTTVTVPSGGSLTLDEGYYPKTFITLDQILDGKTDTAGTASGDLKSGFVAYDVDGNKLTGTLPLLVQNTDFTINSTTLGGSTSATISGPTYNSTSGKFDLSSSGSDSSTLNITAGKEGWVTKNEVVYTGTVSSGSITGSISLSKIAGSTTITGTTTAKPTISKQDFTISGVINAANGNATTTAPTSGVYVKVKSAANTGTLTATPGVTTAGYGTSSVHGISAGTATVGASASDDTYIPIKTGSASVTGGSIGGSATGPTINTDGKYDIKFSASGTVNGSVTTGWISGISGGTVTAGATKTLNAAALTHGTSATETKASVAVSGTRSSNLAAPGTDTTYYVTVGGTATNGSVTHGASVSEGYVPTAGLSANATITTHADVTGSGKVYLKGTSITGSVSGTTTNATGGSYANPNLLTSAPTAPYIDFSGNGSATSGAVYNGSATAAHKYMKIYTGSYDEV